METSREWCHGNGGEQNKENGGRNVLAPKPGVNGQDLEIGAR